MGLFQRAAEAVAEGSTDAAAWSYPQIFGAQSFALDEITLYTRILALSRPKSILQSSDGRLFHPGLISTPWCGAPVADRP
jgi:hypothetical protein